MKIKNYLFGFIAICAVGFSVPAIAVHSYKHAVEDFENTVKMAEQGDAKAQNWLGGIYQLGSSENGIAKSLKTAVQWYRKSAEQGHASGQNYLGDMYEYGKGVFEDHKTAVQWFRKSAKQGYTYGQNSLGEMYEYGKGVPKDYVRAYMWYLLASLDNGMTGDKDNVAKKMTSTEIEKAKNLAPTCLNSNYQDC